MNALGVFWALMCHAALLRYKALRDTAAQERKLFEEQLARLKDENEALKAKLQHETATAE